MSNRILSKMDHIRHTQRVLSASYEVLGVVHHRLCTHENVLGYSRNKPSRLPDDLKITVEIMTITKSSFDQMTPMMKHTYREDLTHTLDSYLKEEGMATYIPNTDHAHPPVVVTIHKDTFNKRV